MSKNPDSPSQKDIIAYNRKEYRKNEMVNHPNHYGGEDNPYEAIKVIENWDLGFNDLKKASWYINREINKLKK